MTLILTPPPSPTALPRQRRLRRCIAALDGLFGFVDHGGIRSGTVCRIKIKMAWLSLGVCGRGHYTIFLELAERVAPATEVTTPWKEMIDAEATIISTQPPGPRMHRGIA